MEKSLVQSVSFKKSEKDLLKHALRHDSFSRYIKELIAYDKKRLENIFTQEEIEMIKIIVDEKLKEK